ncbi:peptide-N4-(N-acetyl-beta-glucosaminyl)asparagine amidase A-like [Andrographis paniculata]|uniref:peptide-N4-(N-acetyl-beta- glucosaminyl)asparagine amidase A-like n=1 Tax=Andrographis paniculata TaxID=175694 RepID=UPI0021E80F76|nr:peptide-N4-(N-acetyl-beta-glucosaminyl)asparagine amidase A-like [Andrographis paniculata]
MPPPPPPLLLLLHVFFLFRAILADPVLVEQENIRFSTHQENRLSSGGPPVEHIAVVRPLPTEKLTPVSIQRVLSHAFGHTVGLPPATATYYAPSCSWNRAVLEIAGHCNGTQYDRIGGAWLSGVELIRTSTPQSRSEGTFWKVRKDITRYQYLLRQTNITLSVMLENSIDLIHYGSYFLNITFLYYDTQTTAAAAKISLPLLPAAAAAGKLEDDMNKHISLVLDEYPADIIIPICSTGEHGFWFKINTGLDSVIQGITIPRNTYRAVIEVYVSPHGDDETWFANPPDSYLDMNGLPTNRGHGAYRELVVKINNNVVGSTIPFPVIYGGGVNPLFWDPLAAIKSFDFPTYEFELTPFLGMLLDGRNHYYGLNIPDAIGYWLADANLHIWLDKSGQQVLAGPIKYKNPSTCIEREYKFEQREGKFEIEGERKSEWSGWVNSSLGNYTTQVTRKLEFENTIEYKSNGAEKEVDQEVKIESQIRVKTKSGDSVAKLDVESKFPLKMRIIDNDGSGEHSRLLTTKLEQSLEVNQKDSGYSSKLRDSQECSGWMFVLGRDVLSGSASVEQSYKLDDRFGCYSRKVESERGVIQTNLSILLCSQANAA